VNARELSEMVSWMRQEGVIHLSVDGIALTLAEPPLVQYPAIPTGEEVSSDIPNDEPELPQHAIHERRKARLLEMKAEKVKPRI
jgi:hypothetical protein